MKIIDQSWEWEQKPVGVLEAIEKAGRTCYKSERYLTRESAHKFVRMILGRGHESVIEHGFASVRFITNRGVTHELVRHRLASFSQESTRFVRYDGEMEFIRPVWHLPDQDGFFDCAEDDPILTWQEAMLTAESCYQDLLNKGWRPEQAREVLPIAVKTEIVMTCNLREWRHVFRLRTSAKAHPQMRALMLDCLAGFQAAVPILFDDIPNKHPNKDEIAQ